MAVPVRAILDQMTQAQGIKRRHGLRSRQPLAGGGILCGGLANLDRVGYPVKLAGRYVRASLDLSSKTCVSVLPSRCGYSRMQNHVRVSETPTPPFPNFGSLAIHYFVQFLYNLHHSNPLSDLHRSVYMCPKKNLVDASSIQQTNGQAHSCTKSTGGTGNAARKEAVRHLKTLQMHFEAKLCVI